MDVLAHAIECLTCDYHQPLDGCRLPSKMAEHRRKHWYGSGRDTGGDGLRHGERWCGACDAPVCQGRPRLPAWGVDGSPARPRVPVQCARPPPALCADRPRAWCRCLQTERTRRGFGWSQGGLSHNRAPGHSDGTELGSEEDENLLLAGMAFDDPQTIGKPREVGIADYEEICWAALREPNRVAR